MKPYHRMSTHDLLVEHEYVSQLVAAQEGASRQDHILAQALDPYLKDWSVGREALATIEAELAKR